MQYPINSYAKFIQIFLILYFRKTISSVDIRFNIRVEKSFILSFTKCYSISFRVIFNVRYSIYDPCICPLNYTILFFFFTKKSRFTHNLPDHKIE